MAKLGVGKKFSCIECGEVLDAYPPDDFFIVAQRKKPNEENIEMKLVCNLGHENLIYWTKRHVYTSVG